MVANHRRKCVKFSKSEMKYMPTMYDPACPATERFSFDEERAIVMTHFTNVRQSGTKEVSRSCR